MLLAHDVLLDVELVDAVHVGHFHLLMSGHTRATHGLLALDALARGVDLALRDQLAYVAYGYLGEALGGEQLVEAADEEVVVELAHTARRYHRLLAAYRTRELAIVRVLVRTLRVYVLIDALLAERVQTRQALGVAVMFEADLACEKLVVDLLGELKRGLHLLCGVCH